MSVVEQIEQNLLEKTSVAADRRQIPRNANGGFMRGEHFLASFDGAAHDSGDIDQIAARRDRPGLDTRHVE